MPRIAETLFALGAGLVALAPWQTGWAETFSLQKASFEAVVLTDNLDHPWGMAFLPDGRMLVSEREGRLRMVSAQGELSDPLSGLPEVFDQGQGGLLDVALHPDFAANGLVYFTYSQPDGDGARTALARGRLDGMSLRDVETIFAAGNLASGGRHFGSRIVFAPDCTIYMTAGERGDARQAQNLKTQNGTVIRLNDDGSVPPNNPFVGPTGTPPTTYTFGHRNPQGMAVHPITGEVWVHEHGPQGGDEINLLKPGANYGWPIVTFGKSYAGFPIGEGTSKPGMEPPLHHWTPSIAPSGMAFYTGDAFPAWKGNLFVGSLKFAYLARLELDGARVISEERLLEDEFGRVRDVRQGPDGLLYILTDESDGSLVRLQPTGG